MTGEEFSLDYATYLDDAGKYNDASIGKARCLILLEQAYESFPD